MELNIKLSKRVAEIIQEKGQDMSYFNINVAINQASREFSEEKHDD